MKAARPVRVERYVTAQGCRVRRLIVRMPNGRTHELVVLSTARRREVRP